MLTVRKTLLFGIMGTSRWLPRTPSVRIHLDIWPCFGYPAGYLSSSTYFSNQIPRLSSQNFTKIPDHKTGFFLYSSLILKNKTRRQAHF